MPGFCLGRCLVRSLSWDGGRWYFLPGFRVGGRRSESFGDFLPGFCVGRYFVRSLSWDGVGGIFCLGLDSGVGRSEFLAGGRRRAGG